MFHRLGLRQSLNTFFTRRENRLLVGSVIVYTVTFSFYTILRMLALESNAWDLGNYNQGMYTFYRYGKLFVWTSDVLNNPSGSLFGIHFSPILFLIVPFYAVYPRSESLLVIQSAVLALGAVPFYFIARRELVSKKLALILSWAYLLSPALMGVNWFEFHPESFIPLGVLLLTYFFLEKKWVRMWLSALFTYSIIEGTGLLLSVLAASLLYYSYRTKDQKSAYFHAVLLMISGFVATLVAIYVINLFNPNQSLLFGNSGYWSVLGAKNLLDIPLSVVLHPGLTLNALQYQLVNKIQYIFLLFAPFGFLAFLSPISLLASAVLLIPSLLSNFSNYYSVGIEYPAFVIPVIAFASIEGFKSIKRLNHRVVRYVTGIVLVSLVVSLILSNPFSSLNIDVYEFAYYGIPRMSADAIAVQRLLPLIPQNSSVFADSRIFPMVSSNLNAYTIPWVINTGNLTYIQYLKQLIAKSNYVILDINGYWGEARTLWMLSFTEGFGVLGYSSGVFLLKRGFQGNPAFFEPLTLRVNKNNVSLNPTENYLWWGPYVMLPPGEYVVSVHLNGGNVSCDSGQLIPQVNVFTWAGHEIVQGSPGATYYNIDTSPTGDKLTLKDVNVTCESMSSIGTLNFLLRFNATLFGVYEFPMVANSRPSGISLAQMDIIMLKPFAYYSAEN